MTEGIIEDGLGRAEHIAFRELSFLRQQNPGPVSLREARIGPVPRFENRNHVEYGQSFDVLRMVEGHPVGDASSAIVADQHERRKALARGIATSSLFAGSRAPSKWLAPSRGGARISCFLKPRPEKSRKSRG